MNENDKVREALTRYLDAGTNRHKANLAQDNAQKELIMAEENLGRVLKATGCNAVIAGNTRYVLGGNNGAIIQEPFNDVVLIPQEGMSPCNRHAQATA